ncbi:hypothetical protein ACCO45_010030 [Purpureocillium lilacinum]|uniref:Uncharacterized protein n=1 Tax=Purpureocillium lilacinum TaxID=33203 RepID=A0ACC4DF71_PURLI
MRCTTRGRFSVSTCRSPNRSAACLLAASLGERNDWCLSAGPLAASHPATQSTGSSGRSGANAGIPGSSRVQPCVRREAAIFPAGGCAVRPPLASDDAWAPVLLTFHSPHDDPLIVYSPSSEIHDTRHALDDRSGPLWKGSALRRMSVKNAKDDIVQFRLEVIGLQSAANGVKELLAGPSAERLKASQQLCNSVRHSESELQAVYERLRPTSAREIFTRLGLRTLRWPFQGKEVEKTMQKIARCTQAINLALQIDQTNLLIDLDRRAVLARLESEIAKGASFDSRAEEHHPTCLQRTRVDLLQQVSVWALNPSAEAVFWLNGMAGTGKSTIARTVARELAHSHRLGASFFFKRGETDRASMSKVFPTLAADLAHNIPKIAPHVKDAIENCPGILRKSAHEQFDKLVWQPLSTIASDSSSPIPIVVLDALDECEDEKDIDLMFRLLSRPAKGQTVRLKVFLTSRPELPIRLGFKGMEGEYQNLRLHEISQHVITHDITIFFHEELQRIRREYNSTVREERQLPNEWPGGSELTTLVHMAIPLFIFAATVCRFIGDRRLGSPDRQLAKVLLRASVEGSQPAATYLPVLENMVNAYTANQREEYLRAFRIIVGGIVVLASPLSVPALAQILDISKQDIEDKLDMLHSVLSVPETTEAPVRLLHLSFRDFLVDPSQRTEHPFWIDEKETHREMSAHCLRVLECLRQDMCDIEAPGAFRSAMDQHIVEDSHPARGSVCLSTLGLSLTTRSRTCSPLRPGHVLSGAPFPSLVRSFKPDWQIPGKRSSRWGAATPLQRPWCA